MAAGLQNHEGETEKCLSKQLAVVVRSIQWSYAIFWCISTGQPGVLEWRDGYYNGDIKTRKKTQSTDLDADQWGLQRSMQLRELYVSLSAGDSNLQARRPSASLSPEDLTDSEWYYMVCMSFTFSNGQGLPGRTLSSGSEIWLCNAHFAETKIFSRSLLAKSASIQTIVCVPFMGGVLELGTTEFVLENQDLIKQLTSSFWELPKPFCSELSISSSQKVEEDEGQVPSDIANDTLYTKYSENLSSVLVHNIWSESGLTAVRPTTYGFVNDAELIEVVADEKHANISEELRAGSPEYSSNGCCPNQQDDDSFMMEGNNGISQVQSLQFLDNELDDGVHVSWKSSDCMSQSFARNQKVIPSPRREKISCHPLHDLQATTNSKFNSLELGNDDIHYQKTLSIILRTPCRLISVSPFLDDSRSSSFTAWKKSSDAPETPSSPQQKMLKKILFSVAWMHSLVLNGENGIDNRVLKLEQDNVGFSHVMSEWRRSEKLNENFVILKSLLPSVSKVDKASILEDTIDYVKELERRVEELESCRELADYESRDRKKYPDISEKTSDNYGSTGISNGRKSCVNKRKVCHVDDEEAEQRWTLSKDCSAYITVTIIEKEVLIEMCCPWREFLLLEIVDAISNVHLDTHSLQSSNVDGTLFLTIKSKFRGMVLASPGMIKQALYRVLGKC